MSDANTGAGSANFGPYGSKPTSSFEDQVSLGNIPGAGALTVGGENYDFNTGTEDIWPAGGTLQYLAAPELLRIASTNVNDDIAGTGLRQVFISGIGSDGLDQSEVVDLASGTFTLTANPYQVVNFMFAFSGMTNLGTVTATADTALTVQCQMPIGKGISQHGLYRVPLGKRVVLRQWEYDGFKVSGGTAPVVTYRAYARFSQTSPWVVLREEVIDTSVQEAFIVPIPVSSILSPGADVRFEATTDQNGTVAIMRLVGVIYDL